MKGEEGHTSIVVELNICHTFVACTVIHTPADAPNFELFVFFLCSGRNRI